MLPGTEIILRVKGASSAKSLASAVAHNIYEGRKIVLRTIGAGAVNQACKAVAIANNLVGAKGYTLLMRPGFTDVMMPDGEVTALVFKIIVQ